jgi:hypothetical protein
MLVYKKDMDVKVDVLFPVFEQFLKKTSILSEARVQQVLQLTNNETIPCNLFLHE